METSFTLQGTELHTFGPIYMSECFPKETVLNLGIATLLFGEAPTGYPKNRKRAGDDSAFFFLPSLPTTQRGVRRGERYRDVMIAQFIINCSRLIKYSANVRRSSARSMITET